MLFRRSPANASPLLAVLLGLATAASLAAQPAAIFDLAAVSPADGSHTRVLGATGIGVFGVPLAGGADVDGNRRPDVAVAFLTASPLGRTFAGEVDLVLGSGAIGGTIDTAVANASVLRIFGSGENEVAGSEVWIDDVTGDGLGDLLICRQNFSRYAGRIGAGALTILPGGSRLRTRAASLVPLDLRNLPATWPHTTVVGAAELDRLCIWVRTGDVTGDGIADVVVGADQEDLGGELNRGAVYVLRGGSHLHNAGTVDLASFGATQLAGHIAKVTPPPGSSGYHFGATCQIADLDGNGRGEVLAAAALNRAGAGIDAAGAPPGSAQAAGGAPDGVLYIAWDDNFPSGAWSAGLSFSIPTAPGSTTSIRGETDNVSFGEEVVGGLDYDADGAADLFVGDLVALSAKGLGHVLYGAAVLQGLTVDLDTPPPGLRITRILGPSNGALGADTAAQGDFDGDNVGDLAFASPHANPAGRTSAGTVHVLYGRPGGWPATVDLSTANFPSPEAVRIVEIRGAHGSVADDGGDTLAYSAAAGFVDGDGRTDLLINEMLGNGSSPAAVDVGNLLVISGAALPSPSIFIDGFESGDVASWWRALP
jgi:hypothetical protein